MAQIIVTGLLSLLSGVVLALIAWVTGRAIQRATTRRTDAEADKTIGEAWKLVTSEWQLQIAELRQDVQHAEQSAARCQARVVQLEALIRAHDIPIPDPSPDPSTVMPT